MAVEIKEITPPRDIQEAMSRQMSAERNRRAAVLDADGQRGASIKVAEGSKQAAILNAEGARQAAILHAEGSRQAAILEAEGFANALTKINEVAQGVDTNTMGLQYLEMMKGLASSDASKWIVPTELTQFISSFARNAGASGNSQG
jgi:regulator of protease activity HflC (stomatin/prohibitin superfamily)